MSKIIIKGEYTLKISSEKEREEHMISLEAIKGNVDRFPDTVRQFIIDEIFGDHTDIKVTAVKVEVEEV